MKISRSVVMYTGGAHIGHNLFYDQVTKTIKRSSFDILLRILCVCVV